MARSVVHHTEVGELRLTAEAQKGFEALYAVGGNAVLASKLCELSERQLRRMLANPKVQAMMHARARQIIAAHEPMAAAKMASLMQQDTSLTPSFEAARRILDIGGIKPPDGPGRQVNLNFGPLPSTFIMPRDATPEQRRAIKAEWAAYRGPGMCVDWTPLPRPVDVTPDDDE